MLIPKNSSRLKKGEKQEEAFKESTAKTLIAIPIICTLIGFIRGVYLLFSSTTNNHFVAGHVLVVISSVCANLIMLVVTIVKQIQNTFTDKERSKLVHMSCYFRNYRYLVGNCNTYNS